MAKAGSTTESHLLVERNSSILSAYLDDPASVDVALDAIKALPSRVSADLSSVVAKPDSYRDALLIALAVPLVRGEQVDIRKRTEGGRSASDEIGRLLPKLHIKGVVGAYQNIAKNQGDLVRGNRADFDAILTWAATEAELEEIERAHNFVVASVAITARRVQPRPELRVAKLTFGAVMLLLTAVLDRPSGGANEQFIVAGLLEAGLDQEGGQRRVITKGVNVSDRSGKAAGDIEVLEQGRLIDSLEVSAEPWVSKVDQAVRAIHDYGHGRSHIIAAIDDLPSAYEALLEETDEDVSILDTRAVIPVLVAALDRRLRELALLRIYDLLDQKLPSPDLVNSYVNELQKQGLTI